MKLLKLEFFKCRRRKILLVCAAVLAAVWLYFYPAAGCVMVGVALLICCLRVLTGVHHVRDVVCGFALGFSVGCSGMWLLYGPSYPP